MGPVRYYSSIFLRRLPYFLAVSLVVSVASVIIAITLPPSYEAQMRLIVESPQIPAHMASSTVNTTAFEQLQIVEQRLLTRPVLLDIARKQLVLENIDNASPDQIVGIMRNNTTIQINAGQGQASLMTIFFNARSGQIAAGVLNEYLTEIQKLDVSYRKDRASDTLSFFEKEVERLGKELDIRSSRILEFERENSEALPSNLQFRTAQQAALQTNLEQTDQQIFSLKSQREKLLEIYGSTGQIVGVTPQNRTPAQAQLDQLRNELDTKLAIYSETNPQIRLLRARIAKLEETVVAEQAASTAATNAQTGNSTLDLQLAQFDSQISALEDQRISIVDRLAKLTLTIDQTPANAIALAELQRDHGHIQAQYNSVVDRLAAASTGERIEVTAQGQRISVIEYPVAPAAPTKPDRMMVAAGGTAFGISLGLALVVLLELLNRTVRRPEDLINKLEVWPIATIPYLPTRGEMIRRRIAWSMGVVAILIGVPAAVWAFHTYYLPLDLIAEQVIEKLEVYW